MDTKASRQIRSRYLINHTLFTDPFYVFYDGVDCQENNRSVYILVFRSTVVSTGFATLCTQTLQPYLYQRIPGTFQLLDIEYDGTGIYLIYDNPNRSLVSFDLYLKRIKRDPDSSEKRYKLLVGVADILHELEKKQSVFAGFSLNNLFVTQSGGVVLGPARVNVMCLAYFFNTVDVFDGSIFLAPEFLQSFTLSTQTDIYAFGVLSYYIVCSAWPYGHPHSMDELRNDMMQNPVPCQTANPNVSDPLNFFIMKSMQLRPSDRWQTMGAMCNMLKGSDNILIESLTKNDEVAPTIFGEGVSTASTSKRRGLGIVLNVIAVGVLIFLIIKWVDGYVWRQGVIDIPSIQNRPLGDAKNQLTDLNLVVSSVDYRHHPNIPDGYVVETTPPIGRSIKSGRSIQLVVSKGPQERLVPSLIGKTLDDVAFILKDSNLNVTSHDRVFSDTVPMGVVVSQMPLPDQYMFDQGVIQVTVSRGPAVQVNSVRRINDDFKSITMTFQFSQQEAGSAVAIVERRNGNQDQRIHEGLYYDNDDAVHDVIIHEASIFFVELNGHVVYTYRGDEAL